MREQGLPKLLSWRWAPCAALVLGSLSFIAFTLLAIPERIGSGAAARGHAASPLANHLARAQADGEREATEWSGSSDPPSTGVSSITRLASRASEGFPKRGFTPPLDRPEAQQPPPSSIIPAPPPDALPPAATPPPPPPMVEPQATEATPVPPPPDAPSQQQPQPAAAP